METVVEIAPPPRFKEIRRESALQKHIWCVKTREGGIFVSRSIPAIVRAMQARGIKRWPTALYRANHKHTISIRCRTIEELNAALVGEESVVFVVFDPKCWFIDDEKDATSDLGGT